MHPEAWDCLFDASSFGGWGAAGGGGEAGEGTEGGGTEGAPFHFYVAAPARTDPSVVERASDDAIMALVPVPPIDERLSAEAQAEACAAAVARARCVDPPNAALTRALASALAPALAPVLALALAPALAPPPPSPHLHLPTHTVRALC